MKWVLILIATANITDDSGYQKVDEYKDLKTCVSAIKQAAGETIKLMSTDRDESNLQKLGMVCITEEQFNKIEKHFNNHSE